jgi:hypothetical protein
VKLKPRIDFANILTQSFYTPKSQKHNKTVKQSVFFSFLGSLHAKAWHKMLVNLTPRLNFIKVLCTSFTRADPKSIKYTDDFTLFLRFRELQT